MKKIQNNYFWAKVFICFRLQIKFSKKREYGLSMAVD